MKLAWLQLNKLGRKLTLALVIVLLLALATGAFAMYKMKDLWSGPSLTLDTSQIKNWPIVGAPLFHLAGEATRVAHLRLNDGPIYADASGHFDEELLLAPGYNIIKLEATDRFGRKVDKILELAYLSK